MKVRTIHRALMGALATAAVTATALTAPASAAGRGTDPHAATRSAMEAQVRAGVPGVLGRSVGEDGIWQGSAGVADRTTHRPRAAEDRFRVGSITKAFTSVVLLQQEAEGRIRLDDTVDRWLPGVVRGHGHDGRDITVRQLLNHTSGIFNYTEDAALRKDLTSGFYQHRFDVHTPRQLVDVAMAHAPDFRPGAGWHYSNTNYVLAGMIVEKVSGHSYASEVTRRVLDPLHLRATTLPGTSPWMPNPHGRAYGKLDSAPDAKIHDVTDFNPSWAYSAGEIISTTGDLNRFYHALIGGKLLPERQQRELLTTVPTGGESPDMAYGLGVFTTTLSCGVKVWGHEGGIPGSTSVVASTPDGRHTAAFNLNADWTGDPMALVQAEYCGVVPGTTPSRLSAPLATMR
ncbi:serine hydrolase domain-containing protein [Streptomyces sp. NPDC051173]|uniref:serine hydrolase domain-containing protein n=1 Tax=Streptomyces sp. NPDC051173 TaxID=3155164 RepID=UPI00344D67B7